MHRRSFLKGIGAVVVAAVLPKANWSSREPEPVALVYGESVIKDNKIFGKVIGFDGKVVRLDEVWAQDGDDLSELYDSVAPGGTLYVHGVDVDISSTVQCGRDVRIDARRSTITRLSDDPVGIKIDGNHVSGEWHVVTDCTFRGWATELVRWTEV